MKPMQQRLRLGCDLLSRYCNLICSPSLIYAGLYMTHSVLKVYLQGTMFVHEYSMYYSGQFNINWDGPV